jgi:DNA-binding PadR family transcriptional regulator
MFQLSHVEFIVLALIQEQPKTTGYQLNALVNERGYREWADIGTTSIYTALKTLKERGYVTSAMDRYKTGKGPKGVNFTLMPDGLAVLQSEVRQGLSMAHEHGGRFMLAMSAMVVLETADVIDALHQRIAGLREDYTRVQQVYDPQKASISAPGAWLFRYSFAAIEQEIAFTETMLSEIKEEKHDGNA